MSITLPSGKNGICFLRGQSIRAVGSGMFCAQTQISSGKIKDARLSLGLARMNLEILASASTKKDSKKALLLRGKLVKTSELVGSKKASTTAKISAVKALSGDFHALERSLGRSCGAQA